MDRIGMRIAPEKAPRVVLLRVLNAGAGTHALGEARVDDARVAGRVLMHERPPQHPGDDLHVAVGVGVEAGAGSHDVVIAHEEQSVVGVARSVVRPEVEGVP